MAGCSLGSLVGFLGAVAAGFFRLKNAFILGASLAFFTMEKKVKIIISLLLLVFALFAGRLFQLQIIEGKKNLRLSENNRIAKIKIEAPRGLITDRHGEILAQNEPQYYLGSKKVNREEALKLQAEGQDADLKIVLRRVYPQAELFAHSIGYLGEVTEKELGSGKLDLKGYFLGSWIGRVGIEAEEEELLKGREGSELAEIDTQGKIVRRMGKILPTPGKALTLALDKKLQVAAAAAFANLPASKKGAVIAMNPENGEILVLYSSPSFDPNLFLQGENQEALVKIIADEESRPLFNRAIAGLYPPGSTFKIVTAAAGLEEKKITAGTLINDPGVIELNGFKYANWYFTSLGKTEGEINVERALTRSTDTFFYKLGEMVGIEKLNFWADKFGVGRPAGIDLPGEAAGFMATPEWKEKTKKEAWFLGNTYHIAIGQGDVSLTPLGVSELSAVVASGGRICKPRMLKIGAENTPYGADCREIGVQKKYLEVIKKGMVGACSPGGTGTPFFDFKPQIACKTGTAETGDGKTSHAWFTAFAPADDPQIVVTVLVERGGEGSSIAAPIAKEILEEYFKE